MPDGSDRPLGTRFAAADESPGLLLWQVTNRWQAAMRAALRPHDLTHVQYVLLASLVWIEGQDAHGPITQTGLAEFAATDIMMTSQVLRALENKGLIARDRHPQDGRARVVNTTAAGIRAARQATQDVEDADAAFFAPLGDPAVIAAPLARLAAGPDRQHDQKRSSPTR